MEQGNMSPQYIWRGDIHGNFPPPNILEVMLFMMSARVTATVVCCILMQILCVVSQNSFSFWGTSSPRPPVFLYVPPNNPVRSTPLTHDTWCLNSGDKCSGSQCPRISDGHLHAVYSSQASLLRRQPHHTLLSALVHRPQQFSTATVQLRPARNRYLGYFMEWDTMPCPQAGAH